MKTAINEKNIAQGLITSKERSATVQLNNDFIFHGLFKVDRSFWTLFQGLMISMKNLL